jgi:lipopolysaccharide biosynthesis glycosyltransferase
MSSVDYGVLTRGAVYRLMIPDVLSQDKAIYLDGDIVVDMDIAELWAVDMAKRCVAVVRDLDRQYWGKAHWERVRHIGVSPELYFNSGVIVMNLTLIRQKHNLLAELPAFLREYPKATVVDQDYLNRLFFQDCVWLTERFNRFVAGWRGGWSSEGSSGAIWHWAGPDDKPWKGFVAPVDILYWRYLVLTPWYSQAEAGIGYFSAEVDRLTSSRSWKMTRPYRMAADWLRINARRWLSRS